MEEAGQNPGPVVSRDGSHDFRDPTSLTSQVGIFRSGHLGLLKLLFHWLFNVTQSHNEFLSLHICVYVSLTRIVKFLRIENSTVIEKKH